MNNKNFHHIYNTLTNVSTKKNPIKFDVKYSFTFVSLISPSLLEYFRSNNINNKTRHSKILLKKSYLILTWLYYMKITSTKKKNDKNIIEFAFLPTKHHSYTLTKAPMAHKTFSKEQFLFKFYKMRVTIKTVFTETVTIDSVKKANQVLLIIKNNFPFFETNLLLLKYYKLFITSTDANFYSLASFSKTKHKILKK